MTKSTYAKAVDAIQAAIRPVLKARGFRVRGRTFNRVTGDGLTQVVHIQMGPSDPPGTTYVPGLTGDMHGLFTVNLGVYVPEVARHHGGGEAPAWIREYHCSVRSRLGLVAGEERDLWWHARADDDVIDDVRRLLEEGGLPFLERFSTRNKILSAWPAGVPPIGASSPPRIVKAIILAERSQVADARQLLEQQVLETRNPGHPAYVRDLAKRIGLGDLDG
jgi:hypothetical protein